MTLIISILSTLLVMGLVAVALGYRHSIRRYEHSPEWFFAMSKVLFAIAMGMRLLFWDVIWGTLRATDREAAIRFSDAIGGVNSNVVSILIGLVGVYCSLKARQLLLAEEERKHWHWLIAWAHPQLLGFPRRRD